ncbi:sugar-binding transcriptional regulator [Arthrobacter ruber]|uniref:sugar-binding transcriptional regulator n=1 Tax=Arthrobacter ruber TaxID=1258893 RepID=UPI0013000738|nr:sugar-binding domain-containing protein [Arthrobacter ruber]
MSSSRPPKEPLQQQVLMAGVARAYYLEGQSKVEIAAKFGLSRFHIARLLESALATGVVTIQVHDPRPPAAPREMELASILGIETVRIVGDPAARELHVERVGGAVLDQLATDIRPGMTVGISWSRTLDRAAHLLAALPSCTVVQLTGAFDTTGGGTFRRLLAQLDRRSGITTHPLFAPLVVDRIETAQDLRRQPVVADVLAGADSLDIAVVSIGAWRAEQSAVWEKVSPSVRVQCAEAGAVAEISGLFIGTSGKTVSTPLDGRVIGVSLQQLQRARQVIGFATGSERADAVRAAAASRIFSSLIVDVDLADVMLHDA